MSSVIQKLNSKKLINPPVWLPDNTIYECIMGSVAYGVTDNTSDMDVYGFSIPPKKIIFPHLAGHIQGFGKTPESFDQYMKHHIQLDEKEYDVCIYNIVKFFQLSMENNPNMVDALFVPRRCVLHITPSAQIVRDSRRLFLHKGSYQKFRGYAYSQLSKIKNGANRSNEKRQKSIDDFGYDVKFAYHVVRLLLQVQQILIEGDLDLERNREILKSIRSGEWSLEKLDQWFDTQERVTEELFAKSNLRVKPNEDEIKKLLMNVLEEHYGSLTSAIVIDTSIEDLINNIKEVINKYE